jgi:leader peptidase (prepilin peptidase) / N-methyltransferase
MMLLGAIWGSFAAALCHRWPLGESIVSGRSHCDHCGKTLRAHELVPLLSYLIQRGKCRSCSVPIGLINPLVELACAGLGLVAALSFEGYAAFAAALFFWLFVPLIILDWKHLWLPNSVTLILAASGLLFGGFVSQATIDAQLIGGIAGYAAMQAIRLAFHRLRGVEGMGGGDPKLMGAIGLWVGWQVLPAIVMLASAMGLVHSLAASQSRSKAAAHFPLGSYLGISAIAVSIAQSLSVYRFA